ncbi:phosphotransferase [Streptomyces gamaensis]|uniref:Phosphotransferase n=1 Tax=Streptomyces gamaensis TaxID=1763542 RepID=A0ABW0Z092_9ACTN
MESAAEADLQLCTRVLAAFGLPTPEVVRPIPEGLMNRNWDVRTAGGARYMLKEVLDVGPDAARRQHAATKALAAAGLPVPAPLPTPRGDTLAVVDGRPYALTRWAPGEMLPARSWSLVQAASVGGLLAELHAELATAMPPAPHTVPVTVTSSDKAAARIDGYRRKAAAGSDAFDRVVERALAERERLLAAWAEQRSAAGERGPAGWCRP